ncbi:MAG TPA: hypothetical protein VHK01_07345 [Lacipirellulaceae bacterium]|nr:hypothetical protein [Lacipirellulaceae bacterium]
MTPTRKLLLAAAFVAAGYGVASQLGAPTLHIQRRPEQLADSALRAAATVTQSAPLNSLTDARPRLVPEVQPNVPTIFDRDIELAREPIGSDSQSAFELASVSAPSLTLSNNGAAVDPTSKSRLGPRAFLRNEAPRPLVTEPRTPVNITDIPRPSATSVTSAHDGVAPTPPVGSNPSNVWPTEFSNDISNTAPVVGTTASAGDAVPRSIPYVDSVAAPRAQVIETAQTRSHIIVDGDSLTRLAERYLDDPRRANEIYELNRTVLSHPDVLPIGAEITIPERSASSMQSAEERPLSGPTAIHAASRGGLVPVRPIPHGMSIMPRAQLARPISAEQ